MLDFDAFPESARAVGPHTTVGHGVSLVWDPSAAMRVTVRRGQPMGRDAPSLIVRGENRAEDDWFAVELDLPVAARHVSLTARNYPAHRLFPRMHYDVAGETRHMDLADVAAPDGFDTRHFEAAAWAEALTPLPDALRLTFLIPSTPWFAMEIAGLRILAEAEAIHA